MASLFDSGFNLDRSLSEGTSIKLRKKYISHLRLRFIIIPSISLALILFIREVHYISNPVMANSIPPFSDPLTQFLDVIIAIGTIAIIISFVIFFMRLADTPRILKKPVRVRPKEIKIKFPNIKRKILYVSIGLLVILIISNPSAKSFKEYLGDSSYSGLRREQNWLIYSVYNDGTNRYLGLFFNFFELKPN